MIFYKQISFFYSLLHTLLLPEYLLQTQLQAPKPLKQKKPCNSYELQGWKYDLNTYLLSDASDFSILVLIIPLICSAVQIPSLRTALEAFPKLIRTFWLDTASRAF